MNNQNPEENSKLANNRAVNPPLGFLIKDNSAKPLNLPLVPAPFSYISAIFVIISVAILQSALMPDPSLAPFIFFFPAVSLIALLGGAIPGLLAVVLSALIGNYYFIGSRGWSLSYHELAATVSYIIASSILVIISVYFRRLLIELNRVNNEREKAEAEIGRANEEWNRTFDAISDLTFVQNKNFEIVKANSAFAESLGAKLKDVIGKKCYQVLHQSDQPWANCPFKQTIIDKQPHTEEVYDPKIGVPLLVTTSPIFDQAGEFMGSIHIAKDITEIKLMEETLRGEKAKAEALLASLGDSVVAVDSAGKIVFVNSAFADLVKKDRTGLLGQRLDETIPLEDDQGNYLSQNSRPFLQALTSGQRFSTGMFSPTQYYIRRADSLIHLAITVSPIILDGAIIGAIAVYRDISREIAIDQAKTEFVSLASHQLRTPLASIALSVELLLRGVAGQLSPEQKKYLSQTYSSTKVMAELIKVLLDISRIELGTFAVRLEPVNLVESLNQMLNEQKLQLDGKKLILIKNYQGVLVVKFDRNILRAAVENLVANAIRYTAAGGTITVELEKKDKEIIIKIADNGCGIPEKDKDKIFTKLFRSENAKLLSSDGAGLGLYMVKSMLALVKGRVWFESELGWGTTFFVAIPLVN